MARLACGMVAGLAGLLSMAGGAGAADNCSSEVRAITDQLALARSSGATARVQGLNEALSALQAHCAGAEADARQDIGTKQAALLQSQDALNDAKARNDPAAIAQAERDVQAAQEDLAQAEARLNR